MSQLTRVLAASLLLVPPFAARSEQAGADDCTGFKWDVSHERALFAGTATPLNASRNGSAPPSVTPDRLYRLQLAPGAQVSFPAPPGKSSADNTFGGVVRLVVPAAGHYRVAVDAPLWIDVAAGGQRVPATDYEGQHACSAPRKIVEFDLEGSRPWMLQLSAAAEASVRLVIVAVSHP